MFASITITERWHKGQQAQPVTNCAKPAVRMTVAGTNNGKEDTIPS